MPNVLRPGDELVVIRDCPGYDTDRDGMLRDDMHRGTLLLEKGQGVTLIRIERVLVQAGLKKLSVDANLIFKNTVYVLSVDALNLGMLSEAVIPPEEVMPLEAMAS